MVSSLDVSPMFIFSNLENWEDIGTIYWQQSAEKVVVNSEIKALADKITGHKQGIDAAREIYNWVTQNIHYVAVFLDEAAGYVPHSSVEILRNGYGDCKDHVLLMQALLQAKGIASNPVLVDWGNTFENLPLSSPAQFNHAMIYLPEYNIFANPTDQHAAFGELDPSLSDKFVVIAAEKGRTAHTPKALADQNQYLLNSVATLSPDGTLSGESEMKFLGNRNRLARGRFNSDTLEQIANQMLSGTLEGGTGTLKTSDLDNLDQPVTVKGKWDSPYAVNIGKQVYLTTPTGIDAHSPLELRSYIVPGKRLYPLLAGAKEFSWNYTLLIPDGYKVSHLPENSHFSNATGDYSSSYKVEGRSIRVKRNLTIKQNVYSAAEYPAFKDLVYKPINDARSVMVLEKP